MTRVVVTGASGFIGRHVAALLAERGVEVHALSRHGGGEAGVRRHRVDLLGDGPAVRELLADIRPSHLIHLGWYAVPGKYVTALDNYRWVGATLDLTRAFADAGGRRLVAAGTCAEYDHGAGVCREQSTALAPASPYSVSKDATRRLLESFAGQTDLSTAWGRVFFLYGPGEDERRLVPSVIKSLLAGQAPECTEGRQVRDFLHVRDVAAAFVALALSEATGAVNICSGEPVTVRELTAEIAKHFPGSPEPVFGALPARAEPPMIVGDASRLRTETGWTPQFDRAAGIDDAVAWWRRQPA